MAAGKCNEAARCMGIRHLGETIHTELFMHTTIQHCSSAEGGNAIAFKCGVCRYGQSSSLRGVAWTKLFQMVQSLVTQFLQVMSQTMSNNGPVPHAVTSSVSSSGRPVNIIELYSELWEFKKRRKRRHSLIVKGTKAPGVTSFRDFFGDVTGHLIDSTVEPDDIVWVNADHASHPIYRVEKKTTDQRNLLKDTDNFKDVYVSRNFTFRLRDGLQERRFRRTGRQTTAPAEAAVSAEAPVAAANRGSDFFRWYT